MFFDVFISKCFVTIDWVAIIIKAAVTLSNGISLGSWDTSADLGIDMSASWCSSMLLFKPFGLQICVRRRNIGGHKDIVFIYYINIWFHSMVIGTFTW